MFASLSHPGFHRSALLRKVVAATLMVTAVGITVTDRLHQHISVVVYSRDVAAGSRITAADVTVVHVSESVLPQDRLATTDAAVGNIVVASRSRGAMVSAADFVDSALVSQTMTNTTSNDAGVKTHMVPITLADPTLASLLRPGDTITIITAADDNSAPRVIAAGGDGFSGRYPRHGIGVIGGRQCRGGGGGKSVTAFGSCSYGGSGGVISAWVLQKH